MPTVQNPVMLEEASEAAYAITLLRHGVSQGNRRGIVQGQLDYPLSSEGFRQVQDLATRWLESGVKYDQVISSGLRRALETAELIAGALGAPLCIDDVWRERDWGAAQGLPFSDMKGPLRAISDRHPDEPVFETGESDLALFRRAAEALESLIARPPGTYLVVSHGGLLNALLRIIFGLRPEDRSVYVGFRLENVRCSHLEYSPRSSQWKVLGLNVASDHEGVGGPT